MKKFALLAFVCVLFETTGYSADFFCAAGNVGCLISAIGAANGNGQDNSIFLEDGTYTLTAVNNVTDGPTGLPVITSRLRIVGPYNIGSTIERDPSAPLFRLFDIAAGGDLILDWLGIRGGFLQRSGGGFVSDCGGAIYNKGNLRINRTAIYKNRVMFESGGAICNDGILSVTHSGIRQNSAGGGGGIYSSTSFIVEDVLFERNDGDAGAGILSTGSGVVLRSTLSLNSGETTGISNYGTMLIEGSSIHDGGTISNEKSGHLTVVSTTIFHNSTSSGGVGGVLNSGSVFLNNASIIGNVSSIGTAGVSGSGTTRIQNSIIALNSKSFSGSTEERDCDSIISLGNNVFGSLTGCTVALQSSDKLGDPGVGSFTEDPLVPGSGHLPLLVGSPAIDSANDGACTPQDQLGEKRNGICDIGAIEFQGNHEDDDRDHKHRISQDDRHDGNQHGSNNDH